MLTPSTLPFTSTSKKQGGKIFNLKKKSSCIVVDTTSCIKKEVNYNFLLFINFLGLLNILWLGVSTSRIDLVLQKKIQMNPFGL